MNSALAHLLVAAVLACAGVSACGDIVERNCGLRPCPAELAVEVHGPQDVAYTVHVSASGEETQTEPCIVMTETVCLAYFRDFGPAQVTVRVTGAEEEIAGQFAPEYETLQPNGPDCPPTCRTATVAVDVEQSGQLSHTRLELTRDHGEQSN